MNKTELLALAERCEKVKEGSLGFDDAVYELLRECNHDIDFKRYTSSLDAVAAIEKELLLDGWLITVSQGRWSWSCDIQTNKVFDNDGNGYPLYEIVEATAPTEPLARLAALLKALAEMDEGDDSQA